uniref:THAP-type domain-containing protein n=1 Tax=Cyprinus carpio TaxID=7962 RepID=A0A8C1VZ18_CYPCA
MPDFCAAYGCSNRRSLKTRELALRRDGFVASDRTLLCSEHFRSEDFDRTGQNVRLKDGVVANIFNFPAHLQRVCITDQQ